MRTFRFRPAAALLALALASAWNNATAAAAELDVRAFGAKGDGKTDDTAAVRAALDQAAPGDVVRFPSGTYFLTGNLEVGKDGLVLEGAGTLLFQHPAEKPREMNALRVSAKNVRIRDLVLTSNATTRSAVHGLISLRDAENVSIDRVEIHRSPSVAVWTMNSSGVRITNSHFHHQWADGLHISRNSRDVIIANNTIEWNGDDGIGVVSYHDDAPWNRLPRNDSIVISGNVISNTPARGICASGGNLVITGNRIANTGKAGIICTREGWISGRTLISGNIITNVGTAEKYGFDFYDSRGTRSGIHVQTNRDLLIADNIIAGARNGGAGITLAAAVDTVVRGNHISDCQRGIALDSPPRYAEPDKKLSAALMGELYDGYETPPAFAGSDNVLVSGNFIKRMQRDGIYVAGSAARRVTGLVVEGNFLSDNNRGDHDHVRDLWADYVEGGAIRGNFSAGTSAAKGLSPAQGIGKNCVNTEFSPR